MGMLLLCKYDMDEEEDDEKSKQYWENKLKELDNMSTVTVNSSTKGN